MSAHFPDTSLYQAIKDNDLAQLDKAILCLGPRIHVIHVWCGRTAMVYAARLGHLKQAKILLQDLDRYPKWGCGLGGYVTRLFIEVIPHRKSEPEFLIRLLRRITDDPINYGSGLRNLYGGEVSTLLIKELVQAGAFDILEILARENEDVHIPDIIYYCFLIGERGVFKMSEQIRTHPVFVRELQKKNNGDPLEFAIVQGDHERVSELLRTISAERETCEFRSVKENTIIEPLPFHNQKSDVTYLPMFLEHAIGMNDLDMFKKLVHPNTIEYTMAVAAEIFSTETLLRAMMSIALYRESIAIIPAILERCDFDIDRVEWTDLRHQLIMANKRRSATAIDEYIGYVDQNMPVRSYRNYTGIDSELAILEEAPDIPTNEMIEIVETIESLLTNRPESAWDWPKYLREFPLYNGRPDLVEAFQRYGCAESETDVLEYMAEVSSNSTFRYITTFKSWDVEAEYVTRSESFLRAVLLGGAAYSSSPSFLLTEFYQKCNRSLIVDCVVNSGVDLDWSQFSRSSCDEQATTAFDRMLTERRSSLNLQKLCRIVLLRGVRLSNPKTSLTDAIVSLYLNGHVPKTVVNYLLHRDDNLLQSVYYRLVKPEPWDETNYHGSGGMYHYEKRQPEVYDDSDSD